jgi:hypothetical protein
MRAPCHEAKVLQRPLPDDFLRIGVRCAEKEERAAREVRQNSPSRGGLGSLRSAQNYSPTCHAITTEVTIFEVAANWPWKVCILERIKVAVIKVP